MKVQGLIRRTSAHVTTIHEDAPVMAAIKIMEAQNIGSIVVLDRAERVVGLLSERELVRGLSRHGGVFLSKHVSDLMNRHLCVCRPDDHLKDAVACMLRHRTRYMPVIDENRLVGLVSMTDVVAQRFEEIEAEANVLREIILASH